MNDPVVSAAEEIKELLRQNQALIKENNEMLHKMRRSAMWATIFRVVWFCFIIGVPLALYYFFLEPNLTTLERAWGVIESSAQDVTGIKHFFNQQAQ